MNLCCCGFWLVIVFLCVCERVFCPALAIAVPPVWVCKYRLFSPVQLCFHVCMRKTSVCECCSLPRMWKCRGRRLNFCVGSVRVRLTKMTVCAPGVCLCVWAVTVWLVETMWLVSMLWFPLSFLKSGFISSDHFYFLSKHNNTKHPTLPK